MQESTQYCSAEAVLSRGWTESTRRASTLKKVVASFTDDPNMSHGPVGRSQQKQTCTSKSGSVSSTADWIN